MADKPIIHNPDGSFSTERTITVEQDGKFFNIPTIVNGVQKTPDEAVASWRLGNNAAVDSAVSLDEAVEKAKQRSINIGTKRGAEAKATFAMPGDHPADAFIHDVLLKKFPGIEDKATAFMESQRQAGDENFSANPLTTMMVALRDQVKPDMPFEEFVTKFRDRALKAMKKHNLKPYSVDVGPPKVLEPTGAAPALAAANILKTIVSPLWDGAVGTMRVAASPLADLPENQDPAQREAIRRGLMPPLGEVERKKGQVEVLQGLLGAAAGGQVGADIGLAKAGASHVGGAAGFIKNVIEGGAWGGAFGAAHGAGQEEAAKEILAEAEGGAKAGATLVAGLSILGRGVGAGLKRYKTYKLEKLLADIDSERGAVNAHMGEMNVPDALAELLPDGGLARTVAETSRNVRDAVVNARPYSPRAELPANTQRFSNITMPDAVRANLSPEKVMFLQRADELMKEKSIHMNYETGELTAVPQKGKGIGAPGIPESTTARVSAEAPVNVLPPGTATIHLPAGMEADASKEVSYRLVYGDRVFSEKSAEYDLLPPEAKQKIDFWTYLDKTEGSQASQFMRNLERSAKTRLSNRASKRAGTAFDITAASLEGAYDLTDAAVIGAAKLYRLSHLAPDIAAKVWNNEMLQVLGDTASARSALWRVYQNSQKQMEKMTMNMAPEMHDVRNLMEKYEQGKAGLDWYTNAYTELERMYGREDARLMAHLLAINSVATNTETNVTFALRDFARLKNGQSPIGGRFPTMQKKMIADMLQGKPYGGQKVQNFINLLLGGTGHAVNDIQVARSIGWIRDKFSKNQYRFVDEVIRGLAKDKGVSAEQYQAALWTTPRIAQAQENEMVKDALKLWKTRRPQGNDELRVMANNYMKDAGQGALKVTADHPALDPVFGERVGLAYDRLKSDPSDPAVIAAYDAFKKETKAQYDQLVAAGYQYIPFHGEDPYGTTSANIHKAIKESKTLRVYADALDHPLLTPEENWIFRAVHDTYGHAREGYQFGPKGENAAFLAHAQMYSEQALPAMALETRGQNSWVNYYGDHQKLPLKERPFAEQKVGLLPEWAYADAIAMKRRPRRFVTKYSKPSPVASFRPYPQLIQLRQRGVK